VDVFALSFDFYTQERNTGKVWKGIEKFGLGDLR